MDWITYLFALTIWREGRGEGYLGMQAIAHLIRNRVSKHWNGLTSYFSIITERNAFSSMTFPGDSQTVAWPNKSDAMFSSALGLVQAVMNDQQEDVTKGAVFYANLKAISKTGWFYENIVQHSELHPVTIEVSRHTFFL